MTEIILLALVKYGPGFAREIHAMFQNKDITPADWDALFTKAEKPYEEYVKQLPTS